MLPGVVTLEEEMEFSDGIQPICAPEQTGEDDYVNYNASVAGWGATDWRKNGQSLVYTIQLKYV